MTVTTTVAVKNARLDAITTVGGGGVWGAAPKLQLYSGTPPANVGVALSGNDMLAEVTPTPAAASGGVKDILGGAKPTTGTAAAGAGKLATFYRVYNTAGSTAFEQGTVGTTGTDLIIDNTSIATGQAVTFQTWTKTEP